MQSAPNLLTTAQHSKLHCCVLMQRRRLHMYQQGPAGISYRRWRL